MQLRSLRQACSRAQHPQHVSTTWHPSGAHITQQSRSQRAMASSGQPTPAADIPKPSRLAKLQQNLNLAGVALFLKILGGNQALAVPHLTVHDISSVNWPALRAAGFKAVVFDKDNTLTKPFEMQVEPKLVSSLNNCKETFGSGATALYSNSAGLEQYDPQGHEAAELEAALGVSVLRHREKKPAGDAAEVAQHFGCQVHELVMVGDRYLTDVVFGNRHGMLTIRPTPLTTEGEPAGVRAARAVEEFFVHRWSSQGVTAPPHPLTPQAGVATFLMPGASSAATPATQQQQQQPQPPVTTPMPPLPPPLP